MIIKNNFPEFVVLPYKEYKALLDTVEDREDIEAVQQFHTMQQETIPFASLQAIASGEAPVRVFRLLRGLSQASLAKKAGISRQYLCQIENRNRKGGVKLLKKMADILNIDLDLLVG